MNRRLGWGLPVVLALVALIGWRWWPRATTSTIPEDTADEPIETLSVAGHRAGGLDAAPCRVRGRIVRRSDGTGVANATVALGRPRRMGGNEPLLAQTDAVGQWSVDELTPGSYALSVTAPGLAPGRMRNVVFDPGKDHSNVDLVLDDAVAELTGTIRDAGGAPIAGARVELGRTVDRALAGGSAIVAVADTEGRYRLGIERDTYDARVTHRDHVAANARVVVASGATARIRDFTLVPGGTIRGRVVARTDGHAIEEAVVYLRIGSAGFASTTERTDAGTHATSAADGSFELRGVPAGTAELMAIAPGFASIESTSVPIGIGEEVDAVELRLDIGYTVSGFVVDADDDTSGLANVSMNFVDYADPSRARISEPSGPDGSFVAHGLLAGRYSLIVLGDEIVPDMRTTIVVDDQNRDDVLVRAGRGVRVRGRVTPPGPAIIRFAVPLSGATMTGDTGSLMGRTMSTFRVAAAAPDGTFEFGPVAPGGYIVEAHSEALRGSVEVDLDAKGLADLTVAMTPGLTLRGRVVDAAGLPVPAVTVALTREGAAQSLSLSSRQEGADGPAAVTDDGGRFVLAALEPGAYSYAAQDERLLRLPWHVDDGSDPLANRRIVIERDHELELVVAGARSLTGRVLDEDGQAVAGAWVTAWPTVALGDLTTLAAGKTAPGELGEELQREASRLYAAAPVLTDASGDFLIAGLRRDRYSVSAQAKRGELQADLPDRPVTDRPTLTVRPLATLHASLAADDAPGGELKIVLAGESVRSFSLRETREFTAQRLPAGPWHVTVEAPGGIAVHDVVLQAGATFELPIDLTPWSRVRGQVIDVRTGRPEAGIYAMVVTPTATVGALMARAGGMVAAMSGGNDARLDGDGRFDVGRLPPGKVTVNFVAMPGFETVATLRLDDLAAGENREIDRIDALVFDAVPPEARGWLGIDTERVDGEAAELPKVLRISTVAPRSPASKAGLRTGDVVLALDGFEVARHGASVVRNGFDEVHLRRGQRYRVQVTRDGKSREASMVAAPPRESPP